MPSAHTISLITYPATPPPALQAREDASSLLPQTTRFTRISSWESMPIALQPAPIIPLLEPDKNHHSTYRTPIIELKDMHQHPISLLLAFTSHLTSPPSDCKRAQKCRNPAPLQVGWYRLYCTTAQHCRVDCASREQLRPSVIQSHRGAFMPRSRSPIGREGRGFLSFSPSFFPSMNLVHGTAGAGDAA